MSQFISVFDMLKVGVGPSSSHTLGPWRAAQQWIQKIKKEQLFDEVHSIKVDLYGSLSLTGKGHATDLAVLLGLSGTDPEFIPIASIDSIIQKIKNTNTLFFNLEKEIDFVNENIEFHRQFLPFHSNGLTFKAFNEKKEQISFETYYSIGGGFVIQENNNEVTSENNEISFPYPISKAVDLDKYCKEQEKSISEIVLANETVLHSENEVYAKLDNIWNTMLECMYIGCHTEGILPGGLNVKRRAFTTHEKLIKAVAVNIVIKKSGFPLSETQKLNSEKF